MKGKKKLEKKIRKAFYKATGMNIPMYADTDFSYYYLEEEIGFALVVSETSDRYWTEWLADTYGVKVSNIFVMSVLHEIGHYVTIDDFTDEDYEKIHKEKKDIDKRLTQYRRHSKMWVANYKHYFDIVDEKAATDWAIDFIVNNSEKLDTLCNECNEAIAEFYLRNGVEE